MDLKPDNVVREKARRTRHAPQEAVKVLVPFEGPQSGLPTHRLDDQIPPGPIELTLDTTAAGGELAEWLDDDWWTEVIQKWADASVTIVNAPTPGSLLQPVLLYQLEMLRRVVPHWRIVGYAYRDDIVRDRDIAALAVSPYHEIRVIDQPRPGAGRSDHGPLTLPLDELFGQIRKEQSRCGATTPILVRLPSDWVPVAVRPARHARTEPDSSHSTPPVEQVRR